MNTKTMIGQRLITGFPSTVMSEEFKKAVHEQKIGNVILFRHNVESISQLSRLCRDIRAFVSKETGFMPLIFIDQEGGAVSRLPEEAAIMPGAMALAATDDPENAYVAGRLTGRELSAFHIDFNLAPPVDINANPRNPAMGVRSYGDTAEGVNRFAPLFIKGVRAGGALCCAKHFPGSGDTDVDPHLGLPVVDRSLSDLEETDIAPFLSAIKAGVDGIMTTHILFPQIEKENVPATLSRTIVTGLLREKYKFDGIILSDCMMMDAIRKFYGTAKAVPTAMQAGVDMVLVCHDPLLCAEAARNAVSMLESGEIDKKENERALRRILDAKARAAHITHADLEEVGCVSHKKIADDLYDATIAQTGAPLPDLGVDPIFFGCGQFRATLVSNVEDRTLDFSAYMQEALGGDAKTTTENPDDGEIKLCVALAKGHSCIVAGTYNGNLREGQIKLVNALAETGIPTVCCALRNPYDLGLLPESVCGLAAWQYSRQSLRALRRVLAREIAATGKIPVKI